METLSFNTNESVSMLPKKDILSVFRGTPEKYSDIQPGMSMEQISEIVSDKIMAIINQQFEATRASFELKEKSCS